MILITFCHPLICLLTTLSFLIIWWSCLSFLNRITFEMQPCSCSCILEGKQFLFGTQKTINWHSWANCKQQDLTFPPKFYNMSTSSCWSIAPISNFILGFILPHVTKSNMTWRSLNIKISMVGSNECKCSLKFIHLKVVICSS